MFQKDLTPEELTKWGRFLAGFPVGAVEYAFDCWDRNGSRFPYLSDIGMYLHAWGENEKPNMEFVPCGECNAGWVPRPCGGNARCACWITWNGCRKAGITPERPTIRRRLGDRQYSQGEVKYLWKMFGDRCEKFGDKPLTNAEVDALIAELEQAAARLAAQKGN
jgi:hypothetical protein